jgi:hypothetical protein
MDRWKEEPGDEHLAAYRRIVEHLRGLAAGGQANLERLKGDLEIVMRNEEATRRLLAEEVYGVPDGWLDELLRVRLDDLGE